MATVNLGRIRQVWRGTWATGTAYVKDDVVLSGVNSYICVNAHTAGATFAGDSANWELMVQGTEIPSQTGNSGKALVTDGTSLSWGNGGAIIKVSFLTNSTRTSPGPAVNLTWLNIGTFSKNLGASESDIYVQGCVPEHGTAADSLGCWLQFDTTSDPGDNAEAHRGIIRMPTEVGGHQGGTYYNVKNTSLGAGNHTIYVGQNNRDNGSDRPAVLNPNNSDESRLQQTASNFIVFEVAK